MRDRSNTKNFYLDSYTNFTKNTSWRKSDTTKRDNKLIEDKKIF